MSIRATAARRLVKLAAGYPTPRGVVPSTGKTQVGPGVYKADPEYTQRTKEQIAYSKLTAAKDTESKAPTKARTAEESAERKIVKERVNTERSEGIRRNNFDRLGY